MGAFAGLAAVHRVHHWLNMAFDGETVLLIGSFGASAVILFGIWHSPMAKPRNVLGGHLLSALVGVTIAQMVTAPDLLWFEASLAVGLAIFVMMATRTVHPPGGATALIAVMGPEKIQKLGYWYAAMPVLSGAMVLLAVAMAMEWTRVRLRHLNDSIFRYKIR